MRAVLLALSVSLIAIAALVDGVGCGGHGGQGASDDAGGDGSASGSGGSSGAGPGGSGSGGSSSGGSSSGATTGCAAYPLAAFCDDFENETDASFAANYGATPYDNPEFLRPVVVTSATAYSPTHVLHASAEYVGDGGGAGQRFSIITRNLPTVLPTQSLSVSFSVRIVAFTDLDGSYVTGPSPDFQVQFYSPQSTFAPSCLVEFQGGEGLQYTVDMCGRESDGGGPTTTVPFTLGTWQRITVGATFAPTDAGIGTVTLAVDGAVLESLPMSPATAQAASTYSGSLTLASFAYEDTPSMTLDIDDVVVEQQ